MRFCFQKFRFHPRSALLGHPVQKYFFDFFFPLIKTMVYIKDGCSFTMRTHGVIQAFRFVEGIWLHRKSHQIRFFFRKKTLFTSYSS